MELASGRLKAWKEMALTSRDGYPKARNMRQLAELDRIIADVTRTEDALDLCQKTLIDWAKDDLKRKGIIS